ncbi:uncharacterized protein LOC119797647 [Cyprinodon tularosa]|uniref:uncharacterized protein LOC119797647 n=1 Tax=Cyprinodon tularosa TaxID=77115 RepID=UPI0018E2507B|nr:uncharacterized protein LOC119797647 [Cyprinodon tularosa]
MSKPKRQVKVRHGYVFACRRDTPVKRRARHKRLLIRKYFDTLPEEPEEEEINKSTVKPVSQMRFGAPVPCLRRSGLTRNRGTQSASSGKSVVKESVHQNFSGEAPPAVQVQLIPEALKGDGTPESGPSCITEADSTLESETEEEEDDDDDDEDDCINSSASTSLSSFSSPEIFRKEVSVDTMTFPSEDDLLGLHLHVKNSTLLEDSRAENINTHHPPNLSTIIDLSSIVEKKSEISCHKNPEDESKTNRSSCKSDEKKTLNITKLSEREPILPRKKVWFKSPITSEIQIDKDITRSSKNFSNSRTGISSAEDETLPFCGTLNRPQKARFFHFVDKSEEEAYFQKMRERCEKLRNAVFFPLILEKENL